MVPLRLRAAAHANVLDDRDIKEFVQRDVRMSLTRWGELKPELIAAYKGSEPSVQRFLEAAVNDVDPAFLRVIQGDTRR